MKYTIITLLSLGLIGCADYNEYLITEQIETFVPATFDLVEIELAVGTTCENKYAYLIDDPRYAERVTKCATALLNDFVLTLKVLESEVTE